MSFTLEDTISGLSYKFHLVIGTAIGFLTSIITDNANQLALTFLMGVAGALGAAVVKFTIDLFKRYKKKSKKDQNGEN